MSGTAFGTLSLRWERVRVRVKSNPPPPSPRPPGAGKHLRNIKPEKIIMEIIIK
jgi:hypothetical protein